MAPIKQESFSFETDGRSSLIQRYVGLERSDTLEAKSSLQVLGSYSRDTATLYIDQSHLGGPNPANRPDLATVVVELTRAEVKQLRKLLKRALQEG